MINEIEQNKQRWEDFYAGLKFCYTTEVPPLKRAREAFINHLERSNNDQIVLEDGGRIYYITKEKKQND